MELYESDDKFVFAVQGGEFREYESQPKAIILNNQPIPTKMWLTPVEEEIDPFKKTHDLYNYEFREYLCDDEPTYILKIEHSREKPSSLSSSATFFLDAHFAIEKIEELRNRGGIAEYNWDASNLTFIEIERGFKYENEGEDEEDY
ncbi:hypothetical protein ACFSFY_14335 [Sporosarcina siberiensis]|uniref:Uncharacterized protein n=1 Tax=Sporosarcina siberiensis TaxID=1365606 RepID=A0ABW4SL41_9BACL